MPPATETTAHSLSISISGSGGAGALTTGNLILDATTRQGCYGTLTRTVGPQIRGGEAVAMVRLMTKPVECVSDRFDIMLAMDWNNVDRYAAEIPLDRHSLILADTSEQGIPEIIAQSGAQMVELPFSELAKKLNKGRSNMVALGVLAEIIDLPQEPIEEVLRQHLSRKGEQTLQTSIESVKLGREAACHMNKIRLPHDGGNDHDRWIITGNQATGLGAIWGGVRFVAAYPITPATEILEWMSPALAEVGGTLVQAEDELASANMIIGASYGGIPSLTATSGPGLALMVESLGLAVGSEVPVVVIDVMRGGPSTGIPTKSEQSDLNIAVYGIHGDAPHLVLAPISVSDCLFTSQWSVQLAEAMQVPAIVLSDQYLGQARAVIDMPMNQPHLQTSRLIAEQPDGDYQRYAVTENGVSPMSIPGTPGGQYTADGLEHNPAGTPTSSAEDHRIQLDKRLRKLTNYDYGEDWAYIQGEGRHAVITWGSTTGTVREALERLNTNGGGDVRLIAPRLLSPAQPEKFARALAGVDKILIIEQSHSAQFYRYLRAHYDLPRDVQVFHRVGPILIRPGEVYEKIKSWSKQ